MTAGDEVPARMFGLRHSISPLAAFSACRKPLPLPLPDGT
jgi:hypothetical protein